jgi:hypothetical protein
MEQAGKQPARSAIRFHMLTIPVMVVTITNPIKSQLNIWSITYHQQSYRIAPNVIQPVKKKTAGTDHSGGFEFPIPGSPRA